MLGCAEVGEMLRLFFAFAAVTAEQPCSCEHVSALEDKVMLLYIEDDAESPRCRGEPRIAAHCRALEED
eukprot:3083283-Prymnesium_polylepis.1